MSQPRLFKLNVWTVLPVLLFLLLGMLVAGWLVFVYDDRGAHSHATIPRASLNPNDPPHVDRNISMDESGVISLDGAPVALVELATVLAQDSAHDLVYFDTGSAGDLPFRQILPILSTLEDVNYVGVHLENITDFRRFGSRDFDGLDAGAHQFRGTAALKELPVFAFYSAAKGGCLTSLNGHLLSSSGLYEEVFEALDLLYSGRGRGGIEVIPYDPEWLNDRVATIQASDDTPWKCVAGAAFNIMLAGYPSVHFEAVPAD